MALITYLTRIQFDFGALKLLEPSCSCSASAGR
jgi:hypothetical protein